MSFRRTPSSTKVANMWLRRASDTSSSGGGSKIDQFLAEKGTQKVRSPKGEGEVTINTLHGSNDPAYKHLFQREYAKWSDEGDDGDAPGPDAMGTPEVLKATQDELVQFAVEDGLSESEARELVRGLTVKDTPAEVQQVERNIQKAVAKAKEKKDKADADAKEKKDKADAEAKRRIEQQEAEAEAEARQQQKVEQRNNIRSQPAQAQQAVDAADAELNEAIRSKDKQRINDAKINLARAKDALVAAERASQSLVTTELEEGLDLAVAEYEESKALAAGAEKDIERISQELEKAVSAGNSEEVSRLRSDLDGVQKILEAAVETMRTSGQQVADLERKRDRHLVETSDREFARARAEREQGFLIYNSEGVAERYNPDSQDRVYEAFMTLLGENIQDRGNYGSNSDRYDQDKDDELEPTKSGQPRNRDGSTPSGLSDDEYGAGEFWKTDKGWSAKNSKNTIRTFKTIQRAQQHAKTASLMRLWGW